MAHIKRVRARGRVYAYHRKTGERLDIDRDGRPRDEAAIAARALEINRTLEGTRPPPPAGSIEALARDYLKSPEFESLAPASRKAYRFALDLIRRALGPVAVAAPARRHVYALRDRLADRPATANLTLKVLRRLFAYAVARELRTDNPAAGVPGLRAGPGHRAWTPQEIAAFRAACDPELALAFDLALWTGQRKGDLCRMSWADWDGSGVRVVQAKTGARLWIPAARPLARALAAAPRTGPTILGMSPGMLATRFRRALDAALPRRGLTFHGLRYTAATNLAEAGCDLHEIAAITGHKSLAMLQKYTRDADQRRLATTAIAKLDRGSRSGPARTSREPKVENTDKRDP